MLIAALELLHSNTRLGVQTALSGLLLAVFPRRWCPDGLPFSFCVDLSK